MRYAYGKAVFRNGTAKVRSDSQLSLHTILPLPISYGIQHTKGWSGGRRILRNRRELGLRKKPAKVRSHARLGLRGRWYAPSPRHLRWLLSAGGWFLVWSFVVLFLSCRVLCCSCCVCDLFLFLHDIAIANITRYCHYQDRMVYSVQKGGRGGVVYCAIVVQSYCNSAANAGGRGQEKDDIYSCKKAPE